MSIKCHDVCVIGAGPSGSYTAFELARAKKDVILLEQQPDHGPIPMTPPPLPQHVVERQPKGIVKYLLKRGLAALPKRAVAQPPEAPSPLFALHALERVTPTVEALLGSLPEVLLRRLRAFMRPVGEVTLTSPRGCLARLPPGAMGLLGFSAKSGRAAHAESKVCGAVVGRGKEEKCAVRIVSLRY